MATIFVMSNDRILADLFLKKSSKRHTLKTVNNINPLYSCL